MDQQRLDRYVNCLQDTRSKFVVICLIANCVLFFSPLLAFAQNLPLASEAAQKAVDLMQDNLLEQSLKQWDTAIVLSPETVAYKYERVLVLMMLMRYSEARESLEPFYKDKALLDRGYQLMGNIYDYLEDSVNSKKIYLEGLSVYPKSGRMHYELGAIAYLKRDMATASNWWVKGTQVEPAFATNYYWLTKMYSTTNNRLWAVLYGEAFLNLERSTARTKEISGLLFNVWNASISVGHPNDPINFCTEDVLEKPDPRGASVMNFPVAFEFTVAMCVQQFVIRDSVLPRLTMSQMVDLRYQFVRAWQKSGMDTTHSNSVVEWNIKLLKEGRLKEYLWWLYSYGDVRQMNVYFKANEQRYDTFLAWFMDQSMDFSKPLHIGLE